MFTSNRGHFNLNGLKRIAEVLLKTAPRLFAVFLTTFGFLSISSVFYTTLLAAVPQLVSNNNVLMMS